MHSIGQSTKSPECPSVHVSVRPCDQLFLSSLPSTFPFLYPSLPFLLPLFLPFPHSVTDRGPIVWVAVSLIDEGSISGMVASFLATD